MTTSVREGKPLSRSFGIGQLLAAGTALSVAGCILISFQFFSLRQSLVDEVDVQTSVIADNIAAAMMFRDRQTAADNLRAFRLPSYLLSVTAYDTDGLVFAERGRSEADAANAKAYRTNVKTADQSWQEIVVAKPVQYRQAELGTIVVVASMERVLSGMLRYAGVLAIAAFGALCVSALVVLKTRARVAKAEQRLDYLAYTDPVTELANRRATYDALAAEMNKQAIAGRQVGLLLIDLDNFKAVNDSAGHSSGDALLRMVGVILRDLARDSDIVGRIGGDEFAVVVSPMHERAQAARIAGKIADALGSSFNLEGQKVFATASIGISVFPSDAQTFSELVSNADIALYYAKAAGKNRYADFTPEMNLKTQRRVRIERELRAAVEKGELQVHYQPQFDCKSKVLVGVEALVRWPQPLGGFIAPSEFIPIAEECGLINEVGRWVLRRACADAAGWALNTGRRLTMAVNVSARQLKDKRFIQHLRDALAENRVPPDLLELELTESLLMEDVEGAVEFMRSVRELGVQLSIDDFGTGYSSLAYLQAFPIDKLKIDRSFISLLPDAGFTIAAAVINLAHGFGLSVVAEGVEEKKQLEWLEEAGCDIVQGYHLGRPMSTQAMLEFIRLNAVEVELAALGHLRQQPPNGPTSTKQKALLHSRSP
jgi:diguanylate cyclase (GGDEF)-like protein